LLGHRSAKVQRAAARALGTVGRPSEVGPLLEHARGFRTDRRLKQAIQKAVARIQGRLGNVEAGALSLAEEEAAAGALSLSEDTDEAGALGKKESDDP
jgi:hypothetical protein